LALEGRREASRKQAGRKGGEACRKRVRAAKETGERV